MINKSFASVLDLIQEYDPEYKRDNFTLLSTDLDSQMVDYLDQFSGLHAWVDLDGTLVKVSKLVNGFAILYCKV